MVDFGEFDKMIKVSEKVDKSDTSNGLSNISFFLFTEGLKKFCE